MNGTPSPPRETPEGVVSRLARAHEAFVATHSDEEAMLAFDADGTLWSGDIGNDIFEAMLSERAVREEAREALAAEGRACGVFAEGEAGGDATSLAAALYAAMNAGRYAEDRAFAMMAWAFAGYTLEEARAFAERVLAEQKLAERLHRFLAPIFAWAKSEDVPIWVVSASPQFAVEVGVALFGIPAGRVVAMAPNTSGDRYAPGLAGLTVYGEDKPKALFAAKPKARLLGAFGDSSYDAALLARSSVPVAVRPKSGLLKRAAEIADLVVIGE